jgi:hypothetical protein
MFRVRSFPFPAELLEWDKMDKLWNPGSQKMPFLNSLRNHKSRCNGSDSWRISIGGQWSAENFGNECMIAWLQKGKMGEFLHGTGKNVWTARGGVVAAFEPGIRLNGEWRKRPLRMWAKRRNRELIRIVKMGKEEELMSPAVTPRGETSRHPKTVFIGYGSDDAGINVFGEWLVRLGTQT